jgi:GWxTD domain-containing protein
MMTTFPKMKLWKLYKTFLLLPLLCLILQGCYNPSKLSFFNISSSYEDQAKNFNLSFCAYNFSVNQTKVYYKFNTAGLLFMKHKTKDFFFSKYQISYDLYDQNVPKILLDSATFLYTDSTDFNSPRNITDSFVVNTNKTANLVLAYQFIDLNKKYVIRGFLNIDRSNLYNRNNFLLTDENHLPLVNYFVNKGQKISLVFNDEQKGKLFVSYFKQDFPLAEPPYSLNRNSNDPITRDSLFVLDMHLGSTGNIVLNDPGIYFFQTDTNQAEGFSILRLYNNFPLVTTPQQMLKPLRYINSKQEFSELTNSKNTKTAIDNFWIKNTGNIDRAQQLIKLFYNRVQEANSYFTSYKEGWKTDRGMIYLVLGPPLSVYRSATNETWYYGEDRNMLSITLIFTKNINKFSDNDYTLDRGIEYKDAWYRGVESWRK